jgi:hypothetical protein
MISLMLIGSIDTAATRVLTLQMEKTVSRTEVRKQGSEERR